MFRLVGSNVDAGDLDALGYCGASGKKLRRSRREVKRTYEVAW